MTKSVIDDDQISYLAPPTISQFMHDDNFGRFVIGPLGSGKTMGMIMEGVRRMVSQAPDSNGIRPTRAVIIRNTLSQIRQTCLADMRDYLQRIMWFKAGENTCIFDFPLNDGTRVYSEWILMPIEETQDVRRLLSLQLTFAWISEFRELKYDTIAALTGRIGRYPSQARVAPTWWGIFGESNPFAEGSDWYDALVVNRPDNWSFYRQPGGLDPEAENRENLIEGYYENLINDATSDEWIKVHVHAEYGEDMTGQRVYKNSWNPRLHIFQNSRVSTQNELHVIPDVPVIVGMDFGRTPACVFCQEDLYGRIRVLEECTSFNTHIESFLLQQVRPALNHRYRDCPIVVVADPSGSARGQTSDESPFTILEQNGFKTIAAPSNDPYVRISAVEKALFTKTASPTGEIIPGLIVDKDRCPILVWGFTQDYRYKKKKTTGELEDKPGKTDSSHVHDALQYAILGMRENYVGRRVMRIAHRRHTPRQRPPSPRAWT